MRSLNRGRAAILGAGTLALTMSVSPVLAAEAQAARGTAQTALDAVTLTVSGLGDLPGLTVLRTGTFASTDPAAEGNPAGAPWALANVIPALLDGAAQGAHEARSDGTQSDTSQALDLSSLGLPIGAVLNPVDISATAGADSAHAVIGTAIGQISAVTDLLGLDIESTGVESLVNADGASSVQALTVGGLDVSLGDLLPADVLALLPIDVLIDLLSQLPVGVGLPDVQAIVDEVVALTATIQATVDGIAANGSAIETVVAELTALNLDDVAADLATAQALVTSLEGDVADIEASTILNLIGVASACLGDLDIPGCLADLLAAAQADLAAAQADVTSLLSQLALADPFVPIVESLVAQIESLIAALPGHLTNLVDALTSMEGSLDDIVAALVDAPLLGLDAVDMVLTAVAGADVASSTATVECTFAGLEIAGATVAEGDCAGGSITSALNSALATVNGALQSLPVVGGLVPSINVSLMDVATSVVENPDGSVTAVAELIPLNIELPSIDIDPAGIVDGLLSALSADMLGDLTSLVPVAGVSGLGLSALDDAVATLTGVVGTDIPGLADLQTQLADVLALLPTGLDLTALTTPGFDLTIDPVSSATFAPAVAADVEDPTLPVTGGGAVALAAAGLSGAFALRRRRF